MLPAVATIFSLLAQSRSTFARPYDSTQGVPKIVFVVFWILILLFLIRLAWEFRDKISKKIQTARKKETTNVSSSSFPKSKKRKIR